MKTRRQKPDTRPPHVDHAKNPRLARVPSIPYHRESVCPAPAGQNPSTPMAFETPDENFPPTDCVCLALDLADSAGLADETEAGIVAESARNILGETAPGEGRDAAIRVIEKTLPRRFADRRDCETFERAAGEAGKRHADLLRDNIVMPVASMPGNIGDALDRLSPDERQVCNLRLTRNDKGKTLTWREVAGRFRRKGKERKRYTQERCRQLFHDAMRKEPALVKYFDAQAKCKRYVIHENQRTEEEEIQEMTNGYQFDMADLKSDKDHVRGFEVSSNPRRPLFWKKAHE